MPEVREPEFPFSVKVFDSGRPPFQPLPLRASASLRQNLCFNRREQDEVDGALPSRRYAGQGAAFFLF